MERESEIIVKSACRMCHGICGVLVHMENGRVVKVTGNPDCPASAGHICVKGKASVHLLYHPDRLKFPLKRVGARGEGKWQRISWEEALDTVANKFLEIKGKYGVHTIFRTMGTGGDMDHCQAKRSHEYNILPYHADLRPLFPA